MASALRGSRRQGCPRASCQARRRGLQRAGRRGAQCHLAARRPGRSGRPGQAGCHRSTRRRGAARVRVRRCPRLCAPGALQPGPARAYLQLGRSRKSGAATHMQIPPGRRGGHTPARPRCGSHVHPPLGLCLSDSLRARLDPQKRPAHCRRTPGSSVLPRRLSARTALHFAALHPRRSPDRLSHGPRAVEHTGNLATVTLRQPHPAESRLEPGRTLKPLALQIRIHFSQHEKPFIAQ